MSPDATLRAFYEARSRADAAALGDSNDDELSALREAVEAVSDLFAWLAQGGFSPTWTEDLPGKPVGQNKHTTQGRDGKAF